MKVNLCGIRFDIPRKQTADSVPANPAGPASTSLSDPGTSLKRLPPRQNSGERARTPGMPPHYTAAKVKVTHEETHELITTLIGRHKRTVAVIGGSNGFFASFAEMG